jgi:hypothetical protein
VEVITIRLKLNAVKNGIAKTGAVSSNTLQIMKFKVFMEEMRKSETLQTECVRWNFLKDLVKNIGTTLQDLFNSLYFTYYL